MIQNVEKVIEWLRINELEYFTVKTSNDENSRIFDRKDEAPFEDEITRFQRVMSISKGGRYIIVAKASKTTTRGQFKEEFSNADAVTPAVSGLAPTPSVGLSEEKVNEMLEKKRLEWEKDLELKQLKEQLKDVKEELRAKDSALNNFIEKINPHIGLLLNGLASKIFPQAQPTQLSIGTIDRAIQQQQTTSESEMDENTLSPESRLEAALEQWQAADPESFIELIEFIANFAASGEKIKAGFIDLGYNEVKEMLLKSK
ncbi:MAG: hypothetical protein RIS29_2461 [Bacteroidota bacterium]|jgi:hypothetical protein